MLIPCVIDNNFEQFKRSVTLLEIEEDIAEKLLRLKPEHWSRFIAFVSKLHKPLDLLCLMIGGEGTEASEQVMVRLFVEKAMNTFEIEVFNNEYCLKYLRPYLEEDNEVSQKWLAMLHHEWDLNWPQICRDPYQIGLMITLSGTISLFEKWLFAQPSSTWDKDDITRGLDMSGVEIEHARKLSLWLGIRSPASECEELWLTWMNLGLFEEAHGISFEDETPLLGEINIHV